MKVVYVGMFDEVEIGPTGQLAVKGEPVEVPDNIAASMLEQETNWRAYKVSADDTVAGVLKAVGDDPDAARDALDAEKAGKNRATLIEALEKVIDDAEGA